MNYHEIKQDIIDEILKNRKSTSISKKMGFNFDKVARWQNGSKQLRWDEFCELCKHTKTPLLEALMTLAFLSLISKTHSLSLSMLRIIFINTL